MKKSMFKKLLIKKNFNAAVMMHCESEAVGKINEKDGVIYLTPGDVPLEVSEIIGFIANYNDNCEVKLDGFTGNNVLFVVSYKGKDNVVILEDKSDCDLSSELDARFNNAIEEQVDELDFIMELFETGFTLEDLRENLSEDRFKYVHTFASDHGLLEDAEVFFTGTPLELARSFLKHGLKPIDFTVEENNKNYSSWYGIKAIDTGFDNSNYDIIVDYYGGGSCEHLFVSADNVCDENVANEFAEKIITCLNTREKADNNTVLFCQKAKEKNRVGKHATRVPITLTTENEMKKEVLRKFLNKCIEISDKDGWRKEHVFTIAELSEIANKFGIEAGFLEE